MRIWSAIFFVISVWSASAATLRLEDDRAWLTADGTPLAEVLGLFEQRGAEVLIDPDLNLGPVYGEWDNARVERMIGQLVSPNSFSLEWKVLNGPLGELYQISSIRVFGESAAAAKPLSEKERVLDYVEGTNGTKHVRGEILVGFKEGAVVSDLNALLAKLNGSIIEVIDPPGIYRIRLNEGMTVEEAMKIAGEQPLVDSSEPNHVYSGEGNPNVPINGTYAGMNLGLAPGETAIAVFDSGLDPQYEKMPFIRGTYNALDPTADMTDPTGHGTLVSLIASGAITPLGGDTGDTGAPVLAVRVFDENGMTSSDTLMRAINYAIASDVSIVNLSFGTYEDIGFIENAVQYAAQQGVTIYVASGNDGLEIACNPAASSATRSIGAVDPSGAIADYSNLAADAFYPGSAEYDGKIFRGTSFASPYAAYLDATGGHE